MFFAEDGGFAVNRAGYDPFDAATGFHPGNLEGKVLRGNNGNDGTDRDNGTPRDFEKEDSRGAGQFASG